MNKLRTLSEDEIRQLPCTIDLSKHPMENCTITLKMQNNNDIIITSGSGLFTPDCNSNNYDYWKNGDVDDDIHIEDDDYDVDDN